MCLALDVRRQSGRAHRAPPRGADVAGREAASVLGASRNKKGPAFWRVHRTSLKKDAGAVAGSLIYFRVAAACQLVSSAPLCRRFRGGHGRSLADPTSDPRPRSRISRRQTSPAFEPDPFACAEPAPTVLCIHSRLPLLLGATEGPSLGRQAATQLRRLRAPSRGGTDG